MSDWELWWAWRPVRLTYEGGWRWLCDVERREESGPFGLKSGWEYRSIECARV